MLNCIVNWVFRTWLSKSLAFAVLAVELESAVVVRGASVATDNERVRRQEESGGYSECSELHFVW